MRKAQQVIIDERTDVREEIGEPEDWDKVVHRSMGVSLYDETLRGWGEYTQCYRVWINEPDDEYTYYHVTDEITPRTVEQAIADWTYTVAIWENWSTDDVATLERFEMTCQGIADDINDLDDDKYEMVDAADVQNYLVTSLHIQLRAIEDGEASLSPATVGEIIWLHDNLTRLGVTS